MDRIIEIIKEFKNNNYDSFDEFYNLTSRILYVIINDIVKNRNDTEDLMQETYLKFLENVDNCLLDKYPKSYLMKIGKNNAINFYHKKKHELIDDEVLDYIPEDKEESKVSLGIIDKLVDPDKMVVELHIIGNFTFKEIASIMDKPLGTVLWIYNKAIKKLQKEVEKDV